jgi:glycosyltransferase involved in cell wall biosynthesis
MTIVSAIVPVFNRAHVVGRAVESALAQAKAVDCTIDVIVVDDGSTDDLESALGPYADRVSRIRHACNRGAAAARNTGIAAASGDYIALLDSDDEWLPDKLAKQLAIMRRHRWRASCAAFYLQRSQGSQIVSPRYATGPLDIADLVWGCFVSPGSTLVFERSVFAEVGLLDTQLGRLEDWDWLLRYAHENKLGFIDQPLARIKASSYQDSAAVLSAIEIIRAKHWPNLSPRDRRRFDAALDLERAAALYRGGHQIAALPLAMRSLVRAPLRHEALAAILHNRLARR